MKIAVLGAGAWGTALAATLAAKHAVTLYARNPALVADLEATRENTRYLAGVKIPATVALTADLSHAISAADLALIVTSTSGLANTAREVLRARSTLPIVWACKGFNADTGKLPHQVVAEIASAGAHFGVLSGPSFAAEVAAGLPCALTLACNDFAYAKSLAPELNGGAMRVYSNADLIGVELGGALKNVMAIAAGIGDGMALGQNARAALITRGLAEMVRLGVAMGGRAETFAGLTGLGDLVLTATGTLSRNRTVGLKLAEGRALPDILRELGHVAEGVNSAQTARALAKKFAVEMPISEAVAAVLFDGLNAHRALQQLMSRGVKAE